MSIMQQLHDSEINAKIESFYDGIWIGTLGDEMNGWTDRVEGQTFDKCSEALRNAAVRRFPLSEFARSVV